MKPAADPLTCLELCAGAGGQAIGLEQAGFRHVALVDNDKHACATLRTNRPEWTVIEDDLHDFSAFDFHGVDLLAAGLPCPPFSVAGKQLGSADERDLFPEALRIAGECRPRAILIENVAGFLTKRFDLYRARFGHHLRGLGYEPTWRLINSADFGMTQARRRAVMIALPSAHSSRFRWPKPLFGSPPSVGDLLFDLMSQGGWEGADAWQSVADGPAPTIVGGSKKHGGPDLGPTRARQAWAALGVDGRGIADTPPAADFVGMPRLTMKMVARLQGFPDTWRFDGRKTPAYRQVGNAFPPPIARLLGRSLLHYFGSLPESTVLSATG